MRFDKIPVFGFDRPFDQDMQRTTDAFPNHRLELLIRSLSQSKAALSPVAYINELTARDIALMIIELHLRRGCDQADQYVIDGLDKAAKACNVTVSDLINMLPTLVGQSIAIKSLADSVADQVIKRMPKK